MLLSIQATRNINATYATYMQCACHMQHACTIHAADDQHTCTAISQNCQNKICPCHLPNVFLPAFWPCLCAIRIVCVGPCIRFFVCVDASVDPYVHVHASMRACTHALCAVVPEHVCVHACVHACVRVYVRACVYASGCYVVLHCVALHSLECLAL